LLDRLHTAASKHPLTLISAPAGYGKTTLLASLPAEFPSLSITWLALEEEDNDPAQFLASLLRAIQQLNPEFGRNTQTLFASQPDPAGDVRRIIRALINETLQDLSETWIVVDDLHLITEPAVHAALDYLLERMPPQIHLLIATRHDPPLALARLRARGQLAELRVPDLRFTDEEARFFLNEKQQLHLSPDDLAKLQSRAEGWAAGLRLLAGSLDRMASDREQAAFIQDLALTDRHVFDFLADEVLKRQEPETRTFLLDISVLTEIVPSLCTALTGLGDAQSRLEDLYRRNLFLVQADKAGKAYRFHALFAEFLREHLKREDPGRFVELHRRAAEAQEASSPGRAIAHYLAAEAWKEATQTIEQASEDFLRQGLLQTLRGWIHALPASRRDERPRLLYLSGLCALHRGDLNEAMNLLEKARQGYKAGGDRQGQGETLLAMVEAVSRQHDYARLASLAQQASAFPLPVHGQVQLLMAQVWQALFQGDARQADEALDGCSTWHSLPTICAPSMLSPLL
jgi:LuxR family maltose regulon positive regulatory protein